MDVKETIPELVDRPQHTVVDVTNPDSVHETENIAPMDQNILETYKRKCIELKVDLEKARLKQDNLRKRKQVLEEELSAKEAALDSEINSILADLQLSEPSDVLNGERINSSVKKYEVESLSKLSTLTAVIVQPRLLVSSEKACRITTDIGEPLLKIYDKVHKFTLLGQTNNFQYDIYDNSLQEVITITSNSSNMVEVKILGKLVSILFKSSILCKMTCIHIMDTRNTPVLRIKSSAAWQYYIYNMEKRRVGLLSKLSTKNKSQVYRLEPWLIEFPRDLDVNFKAAIIAAHFFIHFPMGL